MDELTLKLWTKTVNIPEFTLLVELQVHLRSLQFLGKTLESFHQPLPANSILFHFSDGVYTNLTDLPPVEAPSHGGAQKALADGTTLPTSSYDALMRLANLDECVQDALATREKLETQISVILRENEPSLKTVSDAAAAQEKLSRTKQAVSAERKRVRAAVKCKEELLNHTAEETKGQVRRISEDLLSIYPIEPIADKPLAFTIAGLALPNSSFEDTDREVIAAALGHAAHMVYLLSFYLSVALPYPINANGSTSFIQDPISASLPQRTYPLYPVSVHYRFEYGVFLLNKDIEYILNKQGLRILDIRHTLANLKYLLYVLTAGTSEIPARKAGGVRGLAGRVTPNLSRRVSTASQSLGVCLQDEC
jgi:hypothetical protein